MEGQEVMIWLPGSEVTPAETSLHTLLWSLGGVAEQPTQMLIQELIPTQPLATRLEGWLGECWERML